MDHVTEHLEGLESELTYVSITSNEFKPLGQEISGNFNGYVFKMVQLYDVYFAPNLLPHQNYDIPIKLKEYLEEPKDFDSINNFIKNLK
mgnify:CR=1 FL=1